MTPTNTKAWKKLATLAMPLQASSKGNTKFPDKSLRSLLKDSHRTKQLQFQLAGMRFDFAKQWIDGDIVKELLSLAEETQVLNKAAAMFAGEHINVSENRAVLHSALRHGIDPANPSIQNQVSEVQQRMYAFAQQIHSGTWRGYTGKPITDIVHIGIGGSHLGPELVVNALADHSYSHLRIHFVANIDANDLLDVLCDLSPETTLFIIASKSFATLETQVNANSARKWFLERTACSQGIANHFVAVTTNIEAAAKFGLPEDNLLPLWDWVGGRFSLWSAVGLPILLHLGEQLYRQFLVGAQEVDQHFASAPADHNVPLLSALFATWNNNFLGCTSLAVLAYDERLSLLPDYLQQLEMESNGKSVNRAGEAVDNHTMGILWGGTGSKGQHAYHQLLHQGTRSYAADFVVVGKDDRAMPEHHNWLLANAFAQSQSMALGFDAPNGEPHRHVPGNHSTTTILLEELAPRQLGGLLAIYEHKVFCQGAIWDINSFDQWGVELGKDLAVSIYQQLAEHEASDSQDTFDCKDTSDGKDAFDCQDSSTRGLIQYAKGTKSNL